MLIISWTTQAATDLDDEYQVSREVEKENEKEGMEELHDENGEEEAEGEGGEEESPVDDEILSDGGWNWKKRYDWRVNNVQEYDFEIYTLKIIFSHPSQCNAWLLANTLGHSTRKYIYGWLGFSQATHGNFRIQVSWMTGAAWGWGGMVGCFGPVR